MSMVMFYGKAIESSKVTGFALSDFDTRTLSPDGERYSVLYSSRKAMVRLSGGDTVEIGACVPSGQLTGMLADIPLDPVLVDCLADRRGVAHAQVKHVNQKTVEHVEAISVELLAKLCAEWNELTKQQGGEA